MKMFIYTAGKITLILFAVFFIDLSGGKDGGLTASGTGADINVSAGTPIENHTLPGFSPRSGGWQLQTMPNMGNRLVRDLYFTDSLTGYAVASPDIVTDSAHILKTTNGGNNWTIKGTYSGRLPRIIFINTNTGFAGGNYLLKTTNAGENWTVWNWPYGYNISDMQVFGEDTLWFGSSLLIGGGAYRTTNGGVNWEKRDSGIPSNAYPDKIYFYNSRIGFAYQNGNSYGHKTTNGGISWNITDSGFIDIHFIDSINGWRSWNSNGIQRTTNGGINWTDLSMPNVPGVITNKQILNFHIIGNDTLYAVGPYIQRPDFTYRTILYKTTNRGINWNYLIPDTGFVISRLTRVYAINSNIWAYSYYNNKGVYSPTGGNVTIINNITTEEPYNFNLYQNYPNPFNSMTNIKFQIPNSANIKITVFDVTGREIKTILNELLKPGTYEDLFDGGSLSSGVYFYQLIADNKIVQTRKMVMLK